MGKTNMEGKPLKTEPRLKVTLSDEQKKVSQAFYDKKVIFVMGDFGSGKSLVAVHTAVTAFRKKLFNKIWITRPMIKNNLGALPGTIEEKMHPYVYPILQNLDVCQPRDTTDKMRKEGLIEIMPIDVAKGITFMESVVIVDEFQDMEYEDFRTILTRLGKGSKMIFCGSAEQIHKAINSDSCYYEVKKLEDSGLVGYVTLKENHRDEILTQIINFLEKKPIDDGR